MADFTTKPVIQNKPNKENLVPIFIRYTYNRNPQQISLGLKVNPAHWDAKKGVVKSANPDAAALNNKIRNAQSLIEDVAGKLSVPDYKTVKAEYLKRLEEVKVAEVEKAATDKKKRVKEKAGIIVEHLDLLTVEEQIEQQQKILQDLLEKKKAFNKKGIKIKNYEEEEFKKLLKAYPDALIDITDRTRGSIKTWSNILLEFAENTKTVLTFDVFNQEFYNSYAKYLMHGKRNYYNSNFGKHVKQLKAFLNWCEMYHDRTPNKLFKKYKVLKEEKEIIFLTEHELELLWNFQDKVSKDLVKHIHLATFQNLTGLRWSDLQRSYWKVENGVLTGLTKKTEGTYQVPLKLDSRIQQILEMYDYNLNIVTEQKFNLNIKTICKILFEHHEINQIKIPIRRKKLTEESFEYKYKHELLTSHSGRRGFATRMFHRGYNERSILLMMGSKSNEVLKKYIRNSTEDVLKKVDEIQGRLEKEKGV